MQHLLQKKNRHRHVTSIQGVITASACCFLFLRRVEGNASKMVRSVLANYHQGCQIFAPFNGVQCTAIALIALLTFMNCFNSPQLDFTSDFTSTQLDQMLHDGTRLYASISQELQSLQYLGHIKCQKC